MEENQTGSFESSDDAGAVCDRGGVVTARGTGEGLVIRLDGRVDPSNLREALNEFLRSRRSFLSNNSVVLEWVGTIPESAVVSQISDELSRDFSIVVKSSRLREQIKISATDEGEIAGPIAGIKPALGAAPRAETASIDTKLGKRSPTLFDGIEALGLDKSSSRLSDATERVRSATDSSLWDDPDARVLYATLRSGQKIETEHTLVLCGDVNSGAEIVAGGDIIVLGTLRGVAHAGAYDETGGGRFIFALSLQPTQLRIGTVISRGSSDSRQIPEIARVDSNLIVVEPYQSKNVWGRKL